MRILFVGTGAADCEEALACSCPNCRYAQSRGGHNIRTYASTLFDGHLLVDCGPSVPWRLQEEGVPPSDLTHLLLTHSHADHLSSEALQALAQARSAAAPRLQVWASEAALARVEAADPLRSRLSLHLLEPGAAVRVGMADVVPLRANHESVGEVAHNFLIALGEHRCLYAVDTAWPLESTLDLLNGAALDLAVFEGTLGSWDRETCAARLGSHLAWADLPQLRRALQRRDALRAGALCVATHISMHCGAPHDLAAPQLAAQQILLAWDGMALEVPAVDLLC